VDGFDLSKAMSVTSAEDRLLPGGDRAQTVIRQIAVVHLWLFTI
jgi:hypothetical protein